MPTPIPRPKNKSDNCVSRCNPPMDRSGAIPSDIIIAMPTITLATTAEDTVKTSGSISALNFLEYKRYSDQDSVAKNIRTFP